MLMSLLQLLLLFARSIFVSAPVYFVRDLMLSYENYIKKIK